MPLRRVLSIVVAALAFQLVISAALYALVGIDHTIDLAERIFAVTWPIVDGKSTFPLFAWNRTMFSAHRLLAFGHIVPSALALALGPLQLWTRLRARRPRLHRALGVTSVVAQLVGVPCGMAIARFEYGGVASMIGFFGMGATTLACTALGVRAIVAGDRAAHRAWMIRAYAVMWSSAVLFRWLLLLVIPSLSAAAGGFRDVYVAFVFLSWAGGLLAADLYLHVTRARAVAR